MRAYTLSHLSDDALLRDLAALVAKDRITTAELIAHIAEVDSRRLYAPAGYDSMFVYCMRELHLSEDMAYKRIQAGRAARRFPAIFTAVAEGRLHLTAVVLLKKHLTARNVGELLEAAAHKSRAEIVKMLAERAPRPDVPTRIRALPQTQVVRAAPQLVSEPVSTQESPQEIPEPAAGLRAGSGPQPHASAESAGPNLGQLVPEPVGLAGQTSTPAESTAPRAKLTPLAPKRFALQVTIGQETHDKLRHAQALLSHVSHSGDVAQLLDRALDALIRQLEKRKFATTETPRSARQRSAKNGRYIPAAVKRAVRERDQGRCTFVSESGHRCESRTFLEYDHVDPIARGGQSTVETLRLRCRTHNQYEAERVFGAGFMEAKRQEARRMTAESAMGQSGIHPT